MLSSAEVGDGSSLVEPNKKLVYYVAWHKGEIVGSRKIEGYPVVIAGWEEYQFFIWSKDGVEPGWSVTEVRTGREVYWCPRAISTRLQAVEAAKVKLDRYSKEQLQFILEGMQPVTSLKPWKGFIY